MGRAIEDWETSARLAEQRLGRPAGVDLAADHVLLTERMIDAARRAGLPEDPAFDARIAIRAVMSSRWLRAGGSRIVLSDSVAAGFVLTKQPADTAIRLPLDALVLQFPDGYVPTRRPEIFQRYLMVVRSTTMGVTKLWCFGTPDREDGRGNAFALFDPASPEDAGTTVDKDSPLSNFQGGNEQDVELQTRTVIRILRNLTAWLEAFPSRQVSQRKRNRRVPDDDVGSTEADGRLVYLHTRVQLGADLRAVAKHLASGASVAAQKLAMRHIVRGHWKWQAHGPGGLARKRVYVQPYWRGPDGPTAWGRVYGLR